MRTLTVKNSGDFVDKFPPGWHALTILKAKYGEFNDSKYIDVWFEGFPDNFNARIYAKVTNGEEWFGVGMEPCSKAIIGSQEVPYIYEDRLSEKDVVDALTKMYNMTREERREMGAKGRKHVLENYGYEILVKRWDEIFTEIHDQKGSWENRKNYQGWKLEEVI